MNINTKALKGVIEEVEASKLRQKAEAELQREAIKRAVKEHQLDGKAIRIVLQRRAMGDQKRDEQDYFVHAYEHALAGKKLAAEALERGATVREAAAIGGISTGAAGNLAKVVQKSPKMDTPHDADGVVTETQDAASQGDYSTPMAPQAVGVAASTVTPDTQGEVGTGTHSDGVESVTTAVTDCIDGNACLDVRCNLDGCRLKSSTGFEAPAPRSVGAVAAEPRVAPTPFMGDDPGEIPAHLRGPSPANRSLRP